MSITLKVGQVWKVEDRYHEIAKMDPMLVTFRITPGIVEFVTYPAIIACKILNVSKFLGEVRAPKLGQVFKHRKSGALSEMYAVYSSPKVEVRDLNSPKNISHYKSYFALLEDYEYLGDTLVDQAVFFDRKTNSIFCYERKDAKHTLRNLKSGVVAVLIGHKLDFLKRYEFLGTHPKVGDEFTRHGGTVKISGFNKDNVLLGKHPSQLYGREAFMPLYVLMTTWVRKDTSKTDGLYPWQREIKELSEDVLADLRKPVSLQEARENFARKVNLSILIDKASQILTNSPLLDIESVRNLSLTGRNQGCHTIQEFPNAQQWGRMLRPNLSGVSGKKADFIILDYAMADVDLTGNWFSFCAKPHHATGLTLLPQVGDTYASKFHGIEVEVIKVRRTGYTVSDGHKKWKVNSQALGINYKWVR